MPYDLFEHRHRFSLWAAARAAQRGFTTVENLRDALENCGIANFLRNPDALNTDESKFEKHHKIWCRLIVGFLKNRNIDKVTYGRAAKLVAVYLKSMIIIGPYAGTLLSSVAHLPVDRILLQNLSRAAEIHSQHKRTWRTINWTELDEPSYYDLISQLRSCLRDGEPFWSLEKFWTVTND